VIAPVDDIGDDSRRGDAPMTSHSPEILRDRGRSLEEEFFRREDQRLIERRKELSAVEVTREALTKASGLTRTEVLDMLIALGIRAETVAALTFVPLVEVAWADGTLDAKERRAVLERAHEAGIASGSAAHGLLEAWLDRRPDRALLTAWTHFVEGMCQQLSADEAAGMKAALLERARTVARTSGGMFGSRISSAEAGVLAQLERAFSATGR
jgi:hypothetical protein